MAACPKNAIHRDPESDRILLDDNSCVGCKMCVSACPTGAMGFDVDLGIAYKCDLCNGDPQCARVCQPKAIEYEPVEKLHHARMIQSASKLYQVIRNQMALPGM
jgi:Fe-S-cluster-containing hydrogenase component 2